ncbi:MAG: hypothetical protein O7G87_17615, partial [bacterium]|nr:hypothetical protein [bacterium]
LNPPSPPEPSPLQELFLELCQMLSNIPPTLGPTDYNARNIVIGPQHDRVFFLECAKLGWDWSERRLVQYTTGIGAGHRQGNFKSLLTPKMAKQYAVRAAAYRTQSPDQILHWLDGHHIVFHILAASRLLDASTNTNHPLHLAWQNLDARRKQLCAILARPLSDHLPHTRFRSFFSKKIKKKLKTQSIPADYR